MNQVNLMEEDEQHLPKTLRAAIIHAIDKFREEEQFLLSVDKSSRSLGGAIAYGEMTTLLEKLLAEPDEDLDKMRKILIRIGYPERGSADESATLQDFATEIQTAWPLDTLNP